MIATKKNTTDFVVTFNQNGSRTNFDLWESTGTLPNFFTDSIYPSSTSTVRTFELVKINDRALPEIIETETTSLSTSIVSAKEIGDGYQFYNNAAVGLADVEPGIYFLRINDYETELFKIVSDCDDNDVFVDNELDTFADNNLNDLGGQ